MRLTMTHDAEGDGAWGTIFDRLRGFQFRIVTEDNDMFHGQAILANEEELSVEVQSGKFAGSNRTLPWGEIKEVTYL